MSEEIKCPFCGTKIIQIGATRSHVCGNEDCEMSSIPLLITTWDKRYVEKCKWTENTDAEGDVFWDTQCGAREWLPHSSTPCENSMAFCPCCGGELIEEVKDE